MTTMTNRIVLHLYGHVLNKQFCMETREDILGAPAVNAARFGKTPTKDASLDQYKPYVHLRAKPVE